MKLKSLIKKSTAPIVLAALTTCIWFNAANAHESLFRKKQPGEVLLKLECVWNQGPFVGHNYDTGFVSGDRKSEIKIGTLLIWVKTIPMLKNALGSNAEPYAQFEMTSSEGRVFMSVSDSYSTNLSTYPDKIRIGGSPGSWLWLDTVGENMWRGGQIEDPWTDAADEVVIRFNSLSCVR
ncbi:MAG: hypothetical protein ABJN22_14675 [Litorimonas sp.]